MSHPKLHVRVRDRRSVQLAGRDVMAEHLQERMQELLEFAHFRGYAIDVATKNNNNTVVTISDRVKDGMVIDHMLAGGKQYSAAL